MASRILAMTRKEGEHDLFARIPADLWEKLRAEAREENRSATAQLIVILRQRYDRKTKKS